MKREVGRTQNNPPVVGAAVRTPKGASLYDLSEALSTEGVPTAEASWQAPTFIVALQANFTFHHW